MSRLAICVLNWNGADDAIKCIDSLLVQTVKTDIILVDNFSSDDSAQRLQSYIDKHSGVTFIKNSINSGFTGGNNAGFSAALKEGYDYIGTLNPDATAEPNWAEELLLELKGDPSVGLATGTLARSDKISTDSTGDFYTTWGIPSPRGRNKPLGEAPNKPEYVFGSTGGGFIATAEALREIGLFDEKFFMYFEDVDFSFRAQLAGYKVRYTPKAVAYHKISASTNKVPGLAVYNTFKNLPILFIKNVPLKLMPIIWPRFTLAYFLIMGNAIKNGSGKYAIKGWLKKFTLLPHALRERKRIQSNAKVSADYIKSIILHDIPPEQTGLRKFRAFFTGKQ